MSKPFRDFASVRHELDVRYVDQRNSLICYYIGMALVLSAPIATLVIFSCNTDTWKYPELHAPDIVEHKAPPIAETIDEGWTITNKKYVTEDENRNEF